MDTHHGDDADQHGSQRGADRHRHGHEPEVEEEQVDAHEELGGHEADVLHEVRQDAQQQHQQHEERDDHGLHDSPRQHHLRVQLQARETKGFKITAGQEDKTRYSSPERNDSVVQSNNVCLLKAYSPANRTGSPQSGLLQNMHIT